MYSRLMFVSKIQPDSLLKLQTFNNNYFLQIGPFFGVLYKEEKTRRFQSSAKRVLSGLISDIP